MEGLRTKQQLTTRRTTLLASLSRAEQFMERYNEERDKLEASIRLENLNMLWQALEEVQTELEDGEETNEGLVRNLNFRAHFEPMLFKIKAFLCSKIPPPISSHNDLPHNTNTGSTSALHGLKLPTISLPEFSGDYKDWLAFHDTFSALIHSNPDVADIQKFHYLRAALKGEAAQIVESIGISAANYKLAWDSLTNRYSNEYLLKKRHLQALFDTTEMARETASTLHAIVDEFERHVKILGQLDEPVDSWSTILEHLLCTRLHADTLAAWEDHASTLDKPTYKCLIGFLQRRMRVLESISVNQHHAIPSASLACIGDSEKTIHANVLSHVATENVPFKCYVCDQHHPLIKCSKFERLPIAEKMSLMNANHLCLNCFRADHYARNCTSRYSCRFCRRRHHSLIHSAFADNLSRVNQNTVPSSSGSYPVTSTQTRDGPINESSVFSATTAVKLAKPGHHSPLPDAEKSILMLTVVLVVVDRYGKEHLARALLDCGSQPNIISERMVQILRLKRKRANVLIQGIGNQPQHVTQSVSTQVRSRKEDFALDVNFLVLEKVTSNLPACDVLIDDWCLPEKLFLADPNFNKRAGIDMIIGKEHFFSCFKTAARIELSNSLPTLVDSVFGWLVSGTATVFQPSHEVLHHSVTAVSLATLEESLERFWETEELPNQSNYSIDEQNCEQLYAANVARDSEGRYVVRFPRHPNFEEMLGESKAAAQRRFESLERRLYHDDQLQKEYSKFLHEYIALGHMRLAPSHDKFVSNQCFLPHHPVVKEASTTTKLRVVFDGSAKTSSGHSLNDALLVGPVVQDDLLSIILRFRTSPVALVADIEKMYRQVKLNTVDTPFQRILWRFCRQEPIQTYELLTVTYGLASSSFLATRTLQQLADDEGRSYPLGGPALRKGFYVDDFIAGAQSVEEATQLRSELNELLSKGGFSLRKWTSNKLQVLQGLSADEIGTHSSLKFDKNETVKALGISWEPQRDILRFDTNISQKGKLTKRAILSEISQLFDPLGLIAPVIIRGKILMQHLWLESCGWDDEVPENIATKWKRYSEQLPLLTGFRVSRYAVLPNAEIQLHTFADASETAYGACTYARSVDTQCNISVQLLASKSRVAPLKRVTLPRLELCAADLAAKLHSRIIQALQINIASSFFWSDSMVTLQWLKSPPNTWKTYIANRVSAIQTATHGAQWKHVASKQNPADLVSRGLETSELLNSVVWKHGPAWLSHIQEQFPSSSIPDYPSDGKERRKVVVASAKIEPLHNPYFARFSSHNRLVRVTAYCLRQGVDKRPIDSQEIKDLTKDRTVSKHSSLRLLKPFVDPEGTIRVGGRLRLSEQPYIHKHPALLPSFHPYTRLLAKHYHLKLMHGGGRLTLAAMREKYWPINGRRLMRSVIRGCYQCARVSPVPASQYMGQLPLARITPSRPFTASGVDYAGPIYLKPIHKRANAAKAYICIFVCFSTKAVHIELVSDLSTPAFIAALRRFIARRGRPTDIFSDNGKNFEGAKNELEQLYHWLGGNEGEAIQSHCANEGINWHLNPPKAPNFGGLWEAAVKVAKNHMYRQLRNSRLSFEDLNTVLTEIEAAMNSRPLVPLSEDPNDLSCLTPAHFLIGSTMHFIPETNIMDVQMSRLNHYQSMQRLFQQFWHHWRGEYLQEMQKCTKLTGENNELRIGRLVVIVDEFQHPVKWPLARILSIHPGPDQLTRVVTLRTARGVLKRPITKICLLPCESYDESAANGSAHRDTSVMRPINHDNERTASVA
ncbi:uncharacterized protein LOC131688061 [Topomyia yanbarensis]|uniref:uncharacterized protein LOC131688061 n=1 Tax=Topomyia yanbarensis TaxID=2498891 RepID=UPI00273BC480|nr:uncharacterized protein LOC131688061 [Topomyia yanbarensis]